MMTLHANNFSPNFSIPQLNFCNSVELTLFTVIQVNGKTCTCFVSKIFTYRKDPNITSLNILNVDKTNNCLKIMYSTPFDNTKASVVWGAKR